MKKLTQRRLKKVIYYDPDTGIFNRLTGRGKLIIEPIIKPDGSMTRIYVYGSHYTLYQLALLYMYGKLPGIRRVKYKNGDRTDNRACNLPVY